MSFFWYFCGVILFFIILKKLNSRPVHKKPSSTFKKITNSYKTFEELQQGLKEAGLESSNLILGIDYTKSNNWTGKRTFGGRSLHYITKGQTNPYQEVIKIMGKSLEAFDDDKMIPTFGFGDATSTDKAVFSILSRKILFWI